MDDAGRDWDEGTWDGGAGQVRLAPGAGLARAVGLEVVGKVVVELALAQPRVRENLLEGEPLFGFGTQAATDKIFGACRKSGKKKTGKINDMTL